MSASLSRRSPRSLAKRWLRTKSDHWEWALNRFIGALGVPNRERKTLFIDPAVTGPFLRAGFDTKEKLIAWAENNVTIPNYWLDQEVQNYKLGPARAGRESYATWLSLPDDAEIPFLDGVEVVVVGGSGNVRWSVNECGYRKREGRRLEVRKINYPTWSRSCKGAGVDKKRQVGMGPGLI